MRLGSRVVQTTLLILAYAFALRSAPLIFSGDPTVSTGYKYMLLLTAALLLLAAHGYWLIRRSQVRRLDDREGAVQDVTTDVLDGSSAPRALERFSSRRVEPTSSIVSPSIRTPPSGMTPRSESSRPRRMRRPRRVNSCFAPRMKSMWGGGGRRRPVYGAIVSVSTICIK